MKNTFVIAMAILLTACGMEVNQYDAKDYDWQATKATAIAMCEEFGGKAKRISFSQMRRPADAFTAYCVNTSTGVEFTLLFSGTLKDTSQ